MRTLMRFRLQASSTLVLGSVLGAMMLFAPSPSSAQVVSSQGTATLTFGGPVCGTRAGFGRDGQPIPFCQAPDPAGLQLLQRTAALNAVERYVAKSGEAALQSYERVRDSLMTRFDDIVLKVLELNRAIDPSTRQATMSVRVDINEARLRNFITATSAIASGTEPKSQVGIFMLAREAASVESFGVEQRKAKERVNSGASVSAADSARAVREAEGMKRGVATIDDQVRARGSSAYVDSSRTSSSRMTSTVTRADQVQYRVAPAQDLDAVLSGRLTAAGFETVEAAFFEDDAQPSLVDAVRGDFGSGDDLKAATIRRMATAAQKAEVRYALVGTVDLGAPAVDPVSGNYRVYAKVSAKVYDLSSRLPKTVVNVVPAQFAGMGPDATVAKVNALKNAGEATAREVLAQLSNKQVR